MQDGAAVSSTGALGGLGEMAHPAIDGYGRLWTIETLDRSLSDAAQSIIASRRERISIYRALEDADAVCADLQHNNSNLSRECEHLRMQYNQMVEHYQTLYFQHESSNDDALENQTKSQVLKATIEDERALKQSLKLELQGFKHELAALKDWKTQELQARDLAINKLEEDIQERDIRLIQFAEIIVSLEKQSEAAAETIKGYQEQTAEIERLQIENQAYELASIKLREDMNAIESEAQSLKLVIQVLEKFHSEMKESHMQALEQLQEENNSLKDALQAVKSSQEVKSMDQIIAID
ncbi:hypothetical protein B0T10DRAFT_564923 [Thelonectria olida]|uniref:Uncharacterized protein n=1 Tax=Thelonectria olida TaxID=1576542 RepID=A0A9P8VWP2_9HYPO|nr:hypothetical protein B0T10DRAFT_564923 [Thelonectria olida]